MSLGYKDGWLFVNSATGRPPGRLRGRDGNLTDGRGRVPLEQVVTEARAQGITGTPEMIAGTLSVGRVAIRREIEQLGGYTKQRANQIMDARQVTGAAPYRIAGQPAYTVEQIATLIAEHDAQARRNKARKR